MKKLILVMLPAILCAASIQAQKISGNVKDEQGKALNGATISLKKVTDSALVKLGATNSNGQYAFSDIANGKYFVNITHIGHAPANSPAFELNGGDVAVPDVTLGKASGD